VECASQENDADISQSNHSRLKISLNLKGLSVRSNGDQRYCVKVSFNPTDGEDCCCSANIRLQLHSQMTVKENCSFLNLRSKFHLCLFYTERSTVHLLSFVS